MTKYFAIYLKALVTRPNLIFWGVIWIAIWVGIWVYVYGSNISVSSVDIVRQYQSLTYGSIYAVMISTTATTLTFSLVYSSRAVRYVTKYTKLSPSRYQLENTLSSLVMMIIYSIIYFVMVIGFFYSKYGLAILPQKPLELVVTTLLSSLFMYTFSFLLHLLVIISGAPRLMNQIAGFTPLILGLLLGYFVPLFTDIREVAVASPFNMIVTLSYYSYSGERLPTGNYIAYLSYRNYPGGSLGSNLVDPWVAVLTLITWTAGLSLLNLALLKKARGISIEEIRAV